MYTSKVFPPATWLVATSRTLAAPVGGLPIPSGSVSTVTIGMRLNPLESELLSGTLSHCNPQRLTPNPCAESALGLGSIHGRMRPDLAPVVALVDPAP